MEERRKLIEGRTDVATTHTTEMTLPPCWQQNYLLN